MNDYGIPARLTTAETITAGGQQPTIRIRNQFSHTLKDAWRLSESTVEITVPLAGGYIRDLPADLRAFQRIAFEAGQDEAVLRNQEGHREPVQ